jgi:parallel beta-helix repeat protein
MKRLPMLALAMAGLMLTLAPAVQADEELVVDKDLVQCPNAQYTSIQAAVLDAAPGATIEVCPDTYGEEVAIATAAKNGLKLRALGLLGEAVLEGGGTLTDGFTLSGVSDVVIDGFWVQHYTDAGILVSDSGTGNLISHNATTNNVGGALPNANGIRNSNTPGTAIVHNLVRENGHHGLRVTGTGSTDVRIEHNDVRLNGSLNDDDGIRLDMGASGNRVAYNHSERNRHDGIHLTGAHANIAEQNRLVRNGSVVGNGCGVDVDSGGANNIVRNNHAQGHDNSGIRVQNAGTGNVVAHNDVSDNGRNGVLNNNTIGTLIEENRADGNVGFGIPNGSGIRIMNSLGTTADPIIVRRNSTDRNSENGIAIGMSQNVTVEGNHSYHNALDGIRSGPAPTAGNVFVGNQMLHNGEHDAHDENRAANTWLDNHCQTDFPPGTICNV